MRCNSAVGPAAAGIWVCLLGLLTTPVAGQGQSAPPAQQRPNVVERPWTTNPDSPYYRAQAVAAERVRPGSPSIDVPVIDAPPADDALAPNAVAGRLPAPGTAPVGGRPDVVQRPWTTAANSPYRRAQDVAAERVNGTGAVSGASPYPDEYRSPVPAPFQPQASRPRWRPVMLYPALPFRPIAIQ